MSIKNHMTLKSTAASALAAVLLSTALGGTAMAHNHNYHGEGDHNRGYHHIYKDKNFGKTMDRLRSSLRRQGYHVMKVHAVSDNRINVYAKKDDQPYELTYTYPDLKFISSAKKDWSSMWDGKSHHGSHYKRYANLDDIEDRIQQEPRYPAVKERAVKKLNNMGYQVEEIEVDDRDNRGVFEVDAIKDGQDFEVVLGYPNLDILKFERD